MTKNTETTAPALADLLAKLGTLVYAPEGTSEAYSLDFGTLPTEAALASLSHLVAVGYPKVIGNAGSNSKAVLKAKRAKEGLTTEGPEFDAAVATDQASRRAEAFAEVLSGAIASRTREGGGDPLTPYIKLVLDGAVAKAAKAQGVPVPTGKALTEAKEALRAKFGDAAIRAKAQALADASDL